MTDRKWPGSLSTNRTVRKIARGSRDLGLSPRVLRLPPGSGLSAADRFERLLQQLVVLGLVVVVVVQMLLSHPAIRQMLVLAERMEGVSWLQEGSVIPAFPLGPAGQFAAPEAQTATQAIPVAAAAGRVKLLVTNRPAAPEVWLLADGQVLGDFRRGELTAAVRPGSRLQVDARHSASPVSFRVVETTGVGEPRLGLEVYARPGEVVEVAVAR